MKISDNKNLILKGIPASSGIASGRVRIIKDDLSVDFDNGDILVTKTTDPSMVSLMNKAGAIVTDIGGITSHPAIVSRELGIPCVVACRDATKKIKDGDEIIVNGDNGKVYFKNEDFKKIEKNDGLLNKETDKEVVFKIKNEDSLEDDSKIYSKENKKELEKEINDLMLAFEEALLKMDFRTFDTPMDYSKVEPLVAREWTERLLKLFREMKKRFSYKEIANFLYSPNSIRVTAYYDLFMINMADTAKDDKYEIVEFYINVLNAYCKKDSYSLNLNNVAHDSQEIEAMIKKVSKASPKIAKKLGVVINSCYQLAYGLYGDMNPQILYENYGPYYIEDSNNRKYTLVIKEFKNFKPVEFWPQTSKLSCDKIRIVCVYEDVKFSIDAITHTNYEGDIFKGLKYYALEVDGKIFDINKADDLAGEISDLTKVVWNDFKKMDKYNFRKLYLMQRAYNYKNLYKAIGKDWKPENKIVKKITSGEMKEWPKFNSMKEYSDFFLKILDPRNDFKG